MVSWEVDGNNRRELRHGLGPEPYHPLAHADFGLFSPAMFALLSNRDVDRVFPDVSNLPKNRHCPSAQSPGSGQPPTRKLRETQLIEADASSDPVLQSVISENMYSVHARQHHYRTAQKRTTVARFAMPAADEKVKQRRGSLHMIRRSPSPGLKILEDCVSFPPQKGRRRWHRAINGFGSRFDNTST
jgi:hypothetical protein